METRVGVNFDRRIKARAKGKIYKMTILTDKKRCFMGVLREDMKSVGVTEQSTRSWVRWGQMISCDDS